uniref:Uncharacterized protein n=1 Tax=Panagrolaimus superbus TaxID=310955 RepID=A0A914YE65_9BILA
MDIAVINDQKSDQPKTKIEDFSDDQEQQKSAAALSQQQHSSDSINDPITTKTHEEQQQQQLKQYSNILGNNLVLTLSISPPILIIAGVICLTLLLFKIYWILYSPPQTSIIPQHSAATTPNPDYRIPLSIVTADPKKQPI